MDATCFLRIPENPAREDHFHRHYFNKISVWSSEESPQNNVANLNQAHGL